MNKYALIAENIKMRYRENIILNELSIHVEHGDIYGLVGNNGSGKTTLLCILTGLIQNFNGTVTISKTDSRESRFAVVINDPSLFLNMSAFENMKKQAYLLGMDDKSQIKQLLKTVGLKNINGKPVSQFSLGMVQLLKLAMALLQNPDIFILDEPMNGLDPDGIADLRKLLLGLCENDMTIVISRHILSELGQVVYAVH